MHRPAGQPPARHLAVASHRRGRDTVHRTTTAGILALVAACLIGLTVTSIRADARPESVHRPTDAVPGRSVAPEVDGSEDCIPVVQHTLSEATGMARPATAPCGDGSLMSDENDPAYDLTPWPPHD